MAASVETSSPCHPDKEGESFMATATGASASSPVFSPSSDKRFWSNLRNRVDVLLEERSTEIPNAISSDVGESDRSKRLKEDSMLLLKGFDSVSNTLSQLSNNLENALEGVRELAKPPTLTDILHSNLKDGEMQERGEQEDMKKGQKRKHEVDVCCDEQRDDDSLKEEEKPKENKIMKKAKNIAVSMAAKAASLARELKSIKSDLSFMQERCDLLEEENRRLRDGFVKGIRPEEDDLVRLQMEALLAEKSRLANENANLVRENQCLQKLAEYHQITSQDLSASYEQVIQDLCFDFSSPIPEIQEEALHTSSGPSSQADISDVSKALHGRFEEEA